MPGRGRPDPRHDGRHGVRPADVHRRAARRGGGRGRVALLRRERRWRPFFDAFKASGDVEGFAAGVHRVPALAPLRLLGDRGRRALGDRGASRHERRADARRGQGGGQQRPSRRPPPFGVTEKAYPWTFGFEGFPYFDVHSAVWMHLNPREWGWPVLERRVRREGPRRRGRAAVHRSTRTRRQRAAQLAAAAVGPAPHRVSTSSASLRTSSARSCRPRRTASYEDQYATSRWNDAAATGSAIQSRRRRRAARACPCRGRRARCRARSPPTGRASSPQLRTTQPPPVPCATTSSIVCAVDAVALGDLQALDRAGHRRGHHRLVGELDRLAVAGLVADARDVLAHQVQDRLRAVERVGRAGGHDRRVAASAPLRRR